MSPLEQRVREAVGHAWIAEPENSIGAAMQAAFVAFLRVLEDSFDLPTPDPADEATPVHELPATVGAVVLVREVEGVTHGLPLPGMRTPAGTWQVGEYEYAPESITSWTPAVALDAGAPIGTGVKALREVLRLSRLRGVVHYENQGAIEFTAREALKALGEEVPRG